MNKHLQPAVPYFCVKKPCKEQGWDWEVIHYLLDLGGRKWISVACIQREARGWWWYWQMWGEGLLSSQNSAIHNSYHLT